MSIKALFADSAVTVRHDFPLEIQEGEMITVRGTDRPVESIAVVDAPGGAPPTISKDTIVPHEVGRYHFRVIDSTTRHDLHCVAFEPELLTFIGKHCQSVGHGGADLDAAKIRSIVRALCAAPWFDGTVACVTTGEPARSLRQFGA